MQTVVKLFRHSLLQYTRLHELQLNYNKQHRNLVLSVITCWQTQYHLIRSFLESKDSLKCYAHDFGDLPPSKRLKTAVIDILRDKAFWSSFETLRELLQLLDEVLKMSESGNSHLGHVLLRWMDIAEHLGMRKMDYPDDLIPFMSIDHATGFAQCYGHRILPLHIAAYYLLPESRTKPIPENFNNQLQGFFHQYTSSKTNCETLCHEFESFRVQESLFQYG